MGMLQNFMLKQMLKSKMKGVPQAEQERIFAMIEKNPDFFKKIGDEVEKRKKSGQSEMEATMQVMREHQSEFQKMMMQ
jgi:hypothetical protein